MQLLRLQAVGELLQALPHLSPGGGPCQQMQTCGRREQVGFVGVSGCGRGGVSVCRKAAAVGYLFVSTHFLVELPLKSDLNLSLTSSIVWRVVRCAGWLECDRVRVEVVVH